MKTKNAKSFSNGGGVYFVNPSKRAAKYVNELHTKVDYNGVPLSDTRLSFRSGYMLSRKDNANIYNYKKALEKVNATKAKKSNK